MSYIPPGYQDSGYPQPFHGSHFDFAQSPNGSTYDNNTTHQQGSQYDWQMSMSQPAFAHNATFPLQPQDMTPGFQQPMAHLPPSTQEILRQAEIGRQYSSASPEWAAAREQVVKQMGSQNNGSLTYAATATPARGTGRGRGRPRSSAVGTTPVSTHIPPPTSRIKVETPTRGRGRGGRPRGSSSGRGRGGKRKRMKRDDDADSDLTPSEDEASDEDEDPKDNGSYPKVTKSGRSVQKPSTFNPITTASPASSTKKRRGRKPNGEQNIICTKCLRGHSPPSNEIVMCDGCNEGYHQWCHDPVITQDVIADIAKSWFCRKCQHVKETEALPLEQRVPGIDMSKKEREKYLAGLSADTLLSLLLHATSLHPDLPIFPPSASSRGTSSAADSTPASRLNPDSTMNDGATASAHHTTTTAPIRQSSSTTTHPPPTNAHPMTKAFPSPAPNKNNFDVPHSRSPSFISAPPSFATPTNLANDADGEAAEDTAYYAEAGYTDSSNDPPSTYPLPGRGPCKPRSTTSPSAIHYMVDRGESYLGAEDDLSGDVEDGNGVFSHLVADGAGGLVKLDRRDGVEGSQIAQAGHEWVGRGDVGRLGYGLGLMPPGRGT